MTGRWSAFRCSVAACALLLGAAGCSEEPTSSGSNLPPRIVSVNASPSSVVPGGQSRATGLVSDPDNDPITIAWRATAGVFEDSTRTSTYWRAPNAPGFYTLVLRVSDGRESVTDSVRVTVGIVSLTVLSSPPHALITLDGAATGLTTPHTFSTLPAGFHSASLFSPFYKYESQPGVELSHGQSDTLRFVLPRAVEEPLNPGRNDILELGGIAFLPSGLGVVYVARTTTETAIYSTSLFPGVGVPHGVRVVGPVRFEEPISVGSMGPDLFFITPGDSLAVIPIRDLNQDGTVDSIGTVIRLRRATYSPAVSSTNEVVYSYTPSEDPTTVPMFRATYTNGALTTQLSATHTPGKLPCWKPGETALTYQNGDAIMFSVVSSFSSPSGDTLYFQGANTAPAWGKWGAKTVGFLHGNVAGTYTDLMLTAQGAPEAITVATDLEDPRSVAWSPLEELLAVTEHPGGTPELLIVRSLPLP